MGYKKTSTHSGTKIKLVAEFEGFAKKDFEGNPRCADVINVTRENGKLVCKRVSLKHVNRFFEAGKLKKGDMISFQGWVINGKVSHPTRVTIMGKFTKDEMLSK